MCIRDRGRRLPMKIKLIDFGVPEHQRPYRPHGNDAGADVYLPYDLSLIHICSWQVDPVVHQAHAGFILPGNQTVGTFPIDLSLIHI